MRPFDDSPIAHNRYSTSLLTDMKTSTASIVKHGVLNWDQRTSYPRYRSDGWVRLEAGGTPPPLTRLYFQDTLSLYVMQTSDGLTTECSTTNVS